VVGVGKDALSSRGSGASSMLSAYPRGVKACLWSHVTDAVSGLNNT
jgi:hypothetical protein